MLRAYRKINKIGISVKYAVNASNYSTSSIEKNMEELEYLGFTVVNNVFSEEEIKILAKDFEKMKTRAFDIISNTPAQLRKFEENGDPTESQYWKPDNETLIMQAGKGRFDFYRGFKDGMFGTAACLRNKRIEPIIKRLLKSDYTSYSGVIHNTVGSETMYWHRDTDNLTNEGTDGSKLVLMDDFYFTCLTPITVPVTRENGGTEYMVGSHRLAADKFKDLPIKTTDVPLGSALLFNGKINHRGGANNSTADRPVMYQVYHKRWYNDQYRKGIDGED